MVQSLHGVNLAIPRPLPKPLAVEPENYPGRAEECDQRHVGHDRRDESGLGRPRRDELAESVTPHVLVDRDGHEDGARYRLVGVDGIRRRDGREGRHLDTRAGVADDDDRLPIPVLLIPYGNNYIANNHDDHIGNHGQQSHLGLSNTIVPLRQSCGDVIAERTSCEQANQRTNQDGEIEESNGLTAEVVRWCSKGLGLRQVERQEARCRPGDYEGGKFNNGEKQQFPWKEEFHEEIALIRLPELPLLLAWCAPTEPWVFVRLGVLELLFFSLA